MTATFYTLLTTFRVLSHLIFTATHETDAINIIAVL